VARAESSLGDREGLDTGAMAFMPVL